MSIAMPIDPNRSNCSYPSAPHSVRLADPPKSELKRLPSASLDRITFPTSRSGDGGDGSDGSEEVSAPADNLKTLQ
ncbi:hypothetical protein K435DRAFT_859709 [Dendrothele bispora CBS 962.96]|uniref:Uncharacterized protein n=1 Tax=Dendrothele bispora (strain CBS 962.96) TaxID=1314807 RepID=A0A4S8LZR9_DENBC|nr:hypothetical protein K435DRAFT_859709 [Dendrothele bispora CBS 962.96]